MLLQSQYRGVQALPIPNDELSGVPVQITSKRDALLFWRSRGSEIQVSATDLGSPIRERKNYSRFHIDGWLLFGHKSSRRDGRHVVVVFFLLTLMLKGFVALVDVPTGFHVKVDNNYCA
jgi:hypothetical protein